MSGQIFISYRRENASYPAGRLYDRLSVHFPQNQIFMDVDTLEPGIDFVKALEESVGACDVLIAVIGKRWLGEEGKRQLENPEDFVRIEIATALKRDIRVIPVLVENASMPRSGDLPDDLKSLVRRQALGLSHDRFRADSERLIGAVERALENVRPPKPPEIEREKPPPSSAGETGGKSPWVIAVLTIAAVLVVGGLIGGLIYLAFKASQSPTPPPIEAATPSPPVIATPTVEGKALPRPHVGAPLSGQLTAPVAVEIPSPSISAAPTEEELARRALDHATKDHPWVNSLGMKFVPVAGTQVLFSVWDTRVQDFETFVKRSDYDATGGMYSVGKDGWKLRGATWKEPGFSQEPTHPVVGVSWNDAVEFCKWLTKRERISGHLPQDREYRLPKDEEWSAAVGLKDEAGSTPEEKDGKIKLYPWDIPQKPKISWPPPPGTGNYCGEESRIGNEPKYWSVIPGYNDHYPRTSPVGSFEANFSGLYDMGGNVWQWCEDWYDAEHEDRVLRGAAWNYWDSTSLLASYRDKNTSDNRSDNIGFRCVVAVESLR
jgi:formylglycine-generating enzyme required for sulfatase activity